MFRSKGIDFPAYLEALGAIFDTAAVLVIGSIWSMAVRGADNPVSSVSVVVSVGNAAVLVFATIAGLRLCRTKSQFAKAKVGEKLSGS